MKRKENHDYRTVMGKWSFAKCGIDAATATKHRFSATAKTMARHIGGGLCRILSNMEAMTSSDRR